jgi:hypothetical protein
MRDILVNHRIYFPNRLEFNDPFDCVMPSFSGINQRDLRQFLAGRLEEMRVAEGRTRRRMMMKNIDLAKLQRDVQSDMDKAGILSLTERPDNLLMWGHYASSHTGICLEFAAFDLVCSEEMGFFGSTSWLSTTAASF